MTERQHISWKGFSHNLHVRVASSSIICVLIGVVLSAFVACTDSNSFRLHGEFRHLRQVDFFVYSTDGGLDHIDTIHVIDGQFDWRIPLERPATFYVIFPNLSEHVIFADPGEVIKMKGDAQQLRSALITGSKENEMLTEFRLQHNNDRPEQFQAAVRQFIKENPDSRVSSFLRRLLTLETAQPSRTSIGKKLPEFMLPPDGLEAEKDTLKIKPSQPVLLTFWSSWKRNSRNAFYDIRQVIRKTENAQKGKRLRAISISLDTGLNQYHSICRYDSLTWEKRCYRLSWETPIIKQLGIRDIPYYILTDSTLKITAQGTDWKRDIEPTIKKQFNLK